MPVCVLFRTRQGFLGAAVTFFEPRARARSRANPIIEDTKLNLRGRTLCVGNFSRNAKDQAGFFFGNLTIVGCLMSHSRKYTQYDMKKTQKNVTNKILKKRKPLLPLNVKNNRKSRILKWPSVGPYGSFAQIYKSSCNTMQYLVLDHFFRIRLLLYSPLLVYAFEKF